MRLRTAWLAPALLLGLAALVLLAAGSVRAQEGGEGDPNRGVDLYYTYCYVCHGQNGEGRAGATLSDVFVTIAPDVFLTEVITKGREGTFMPAWSEASGGPLTEQDIADLVAYIESWGTTVEPPEPAPRRPAVEIPPAPEVDGDPNEGFSIFQRECAVCHGEDAHGQIGATLATSFPGNEPGAYVIETVKRGVGGSPMPAFAGVLSDQEINHVAAYVLSIQREAAPPVGEIIGSGSAWPLVIVMAVIVVVIVALGASVMRREKRGG
jgi:mono/diheme cytochrome c family protein